MSDWLALRWDFSITSQSTNEELSEHVDCVMGNLVEIVEAEVRLSDPSIGLDLTDASVEFDLAVVVKNSLAEAVGIAERAIADAIHKAGGFTPGWMKTAGPHGIEYETRDVSVQPMDLPLAASS